MANAWPESESYLSVIVDDAVGIALLLDVELVLLVVHQIRFMSADQSAVLAANACAHVVCIRTVSVSTRHC